MKKILSVIFAIMLLTCGTVFAKENSPEWVKNLSAAKNASQILVIAGRKLGTDYDNAGIYRQKWA